MRRLSILVVLLSLLGFELAAQSPHGKGFAMDCAQCHDAGSWSQSSKSKFVHAATGFELIGRHKNIDCNACHVKLDFNKNTSTCVSCHADRHNQTVGNDCARCHTSKSWVVENITKMHENTHFPLVGVHATVDCNKCHKTATNVRFQPLGLACVDCHSKDFKTSKNPDHLKLKLSTDCASCHTATAQWTTKSFANHDEFYPLTGAHAGIAQDCEKCHIGGKYTNTPTECAGCHKTDFNKTLNPNHAKLNLSTDCASCHTTKVGWKPATFANHDEFFPLTGAHFTIQSRCMDCHKGGNFNTTSKDCNSCHATDFKQAKDPNHITLGFSTDCVSCHTTNPNWAPAKFADHNTFFPLTGAHATLKCSECHIGGNFKNTPKDCNSCHNKDFVASKDPSHTQLKFSTDCATCHTTTPGWSPAKFTEHNEFFPLTGAHTNAKCTECHIGGKFANTPKDCNSCHKTAYAATKNPNHQEIGLSTDCATCHTTAAGWKPTTFNHSAVWPLTGVHAVANCNACHKGANAKKPSTDCNSCHNAAYTAAKNPDHALMGLSTDCVTCHTAVPGWRPTTFDHNKFWPLTGAHAAVSTTCNACHKGANAKKPSTDCNSCHNTAYTATKNPNHAEIGLTTDCATCHTTAAGWKPTTFNHSAVWPLTGVHAVANCNACHKGANAKKPSTDCNSCHNAAYVAAKNPDHNLMGLSTDCVACHTAVPGWRPTSFDHSKFWPLTGAHASVSTTCNACHKGTNAKKPSTDCNSCHNGAYMASKNPSHSAIQLSTDCASCHTTAAGWKPTTFNHTTIWPLTGVHAVANCNACHKGANAKKPSTDCNSCHNAAYVAAKNPDHNLMGLSTDCVACHTAVPGWRPTSFDHNKFWPLTGAHASVSTTCNACHKGTNAKKPSTDCNSCHNGAYMASKNPSHSTIQLSTDCASCHTTAAGWKPTSFNHATIWPLTGAHATVASNCVACHKGASAKKPSTDCNSCHNGAYTSAKNPDHALMGLSTDCVACHTTNPGWRPTSFDHNKFWPLTGAHASVSTTCNACHKGTNAKKPSTDCNSCHNGAYLASKNPSHSTIQLSTDCASCHTTAAGWRPTSFNHATIWPLTGAHATVASNCVACHKGANAKKPATDCNSCHNAAYLNSKNPNHAALGMTTDCVTCHSTAPGWKPSSFNHNNYWVLTGAHTTVATCTACHKGANPKKPGTDCNGCHNVAYIASKNPNHVALGMTTDCISCHTTAPGWKPSSFNHNNYFPLTGAHTATACTACHKGATPKNPPRDCNSCHNAAFVGSKNPNHVALGITTDCVTCHSTVPGWKPSSFNHNNYFPLTGAHTATACTACHKGATPKNPPRDCNSCHNAVYLGAKNPDHVAIGLSTDCVTCHSTSPGWRPTSFNHNTFWPLTGAHISTTCTACHKGANAKKPSTDCNACHNGAYNSSVNPSHTAIKLSTACVTCHTTNPGWRPSTFNHNTYFPLIGAHAVIASNCVKCHAGGNYTRTTCNDCHNAKYLTASPNHVTSHFPTSCTDCHSQNAWKPSTWNHDAQHFPIYSGKHKQAWNSCTDCHNNAANYGIFTCLTCHKKPDMDDKHKGKAGYLYESVTCLGCHPRGTKK
jgi:Cytochrome c7 and related cytochrome c